MSRRSAAARKPPAAAPSAAPQPRSAAGGPFVPRGSFPPGRCPHKLTVRRQGREVELRCQVTGDHERIRSNIGAERILHRHGEHTWT